MKRVLAGFLFAAASAAAQNVTIEGRLLDAGGQPVTAGNVTAIDITSGAATTRAVQGDGSFSLSVPPAIYVLMTHDEPGPAVDAVVMRVDARTSVSGLVLRFGEPTRLIDDAPPRASLIQVSAPDAAGDATVSGAPGSVAANSVVALVTLDTGHAVTTLSRDDGSFQATLFAPFGSSILVKADAVGLAFSTLAAFVVQTGNLLNRFAEVPGTIVRAPEPPASGTGVAFGRAGNAPRLTATLPSWTLQGTISSAVVEPGGSLSLDAMLRIASPALANAISLEFELAMNLERADTGGGSQMYSSALLTPTALPIERQREPGGALRVTRVTELVKTASDRAEVPVRLTLTIPADTPPGYYLPEVSIFFRDPPVESPPTRILVPTDGLPTRDHQITYLPVVRVGNPAPPQLWSVLLLDRLANGTRGAGAIEDRGRFAVSSRIRVNSDDLVLPRVDAAGRSITYNLEPFAPMIGLGISSQFPLPTLPLRFPSGSLTVRLQRPDGQVTVIGPAPFQQNRLRGSGMAGTSIHDPLMEATVHGGNVIRQGYQLTTLDPRFNVQFAQEGRHVATVEGSVEDLWGTRWAIGGTYEIYVGRHLSLETAVVPGTPFDVGDVLNPGLSVTPPVPADVTVRLRLAPDSDPSRMIERVVTGRANRFGVLNALDGIALDLPGEYRVDVTASYTDPQGAFRMGTRTWGSVVAPKDSPIIAHGRRGMINTDVIGTPWYFRTNTVAPTLPDSSHPMPPFHSGDVFWAQKSDTEFAQFTFQENPAGALTELFRARSKGGFGLGTFDERALIGEIPLLSSRADAIDPHIDPARVDLWAYSYRFIERPLVAVREGIGEDKVPLMYWGFSDPYAGQIGMSLEGDLPNDFKFHFGGVVLRGSALQRPLYAPYGSLFILVPDDDPRGGSRIFPPFQGNGGGPSGGPLFTLKGKDIDIFAYLTSLEPGAIIETGRSISFGGQIAPTLPGKVEIVVTAPSGATTTINAIANRVGYFFDQRWRPIVNEPGVWKAKVKVVFDGVLPSTNGKVEPPYPTGDVLGSREGEFWFYAVDRASEPLAVEVTGSAFRAVPPATLHDVQLYWTTTIPGFILEEGVSSSLQYVYDASQLRASFPNLDADVVTISLFLSGVDQSGQRKFLARQIALHGDELHLTAQEPSEPRRRTVRH